MLLPRVLYSFLLSYLLSFFFFLLILLCHQNLRSVLHLETSVIELKLQHTVYRTISILSYSVIVLYWVFRSSNIFRNDQQYTVAATAYQQVVGHFEKYLMT